MRDDERRFADVFDDIRDGEGLARTGHAEQRLMRRAGPEAFRQLRDRLGLIAGGLIGRDEFKH